MSRKIFNAVVEVHCIEKSFRLGRGSIFHLGFQNKIEPSTGRKVVSIHREASTALKMKSEFETKINALEELKPHICSLLL